MHLQSLELIGFKSFADKTTFEFHEGVTAIVGPNGCGKSNVLDAVRWVLGEQSAKALRGGEMADVIFNGTDNRKALGFGEVSLTLTNCEADLGTEWHDVRVTRRVYRDGNSDYLLNKTPCRLRDIQALFADTGLGRSAYSVMEQGKIDLILSSRPEDRRAVFEEAAGITKYRTQKREALRKLEATEANLLRLGDIIREVKRQIGSLQRQAGKARRYQALLADLQVLDTHNSHRQLNQLESEAETSRKEVANLESEEQSTHARIEKTENELATRRHDLDETDAKISDARAEVQHLQGEMATLRNRIDFNRQREQELNELIVRYEGDIAAAERKRSEQETQIQETDALIASINQQVEAKDQEIKKLTEALQARRTQRLQCEEELQSLHLSLSKSEGRIATLENDLVGITARRDATAGQISELSRVLSERTEDEKEAKARLTATQTVAEDQATRVENLRRNLRDTEEQLQREQEALSQAEKEVSRVDRIIAEKQARLEILNQMTEEGEGLEKGSQAVLKGLNDPERIRPAIAGALMASLKVDPEFVPALEAAFGRAMHAIVLNDTTLAAEIFRTLAEKKSGQAALAIPEWSRNVTSRTRSDLPKGALCWATDKVEVPERLAPVVLGLLRDVVIVAELGSALELKKQREDLQYTTLKGEFISADGIIFGGSTTAASESILARKSILDRLEEELAKLETERRSLTESRDRAQEQVEKAVNAVDDVRQSQEKALQIQSQVIVEVLSAQRVVQEAEQKLTLLQSEKNTLELQIKSADETIAHLQIELTSQRKTLDEELGRKRTSERARETARSEEEETIERLNETRLALATERQRYESLVNHRQPMTARESELSDLVAARRADIATYQSRLTTQATQSEEAEARILVHKSALEEAQVAVAALTNERETRLNALSEKDSQSRTLRDSLNHLRDLRGKQEVRQTQLQLRIDNLIEHVTRRYQIDLRTFKTDTFAFQKTLSVIAKRRAKPESVTPETGPGGDSASEDLETVHAALGEGESLEQIIAALTRQLDNMGPVNLEAVHEYDELEERYSFLETQNNDLVAARRELLDVISRINSTTQKLFAETFAQVRINFREMFAELFEGGRAELALTDENDPLNCGIEISAKPPGKQSQQISLLSGGERTMTAVALLFAIYMVRPSPFCILDEMDAALDESNINRFIRVLERFVSQSQFIIITHNKRTIAKADILYGVTMEERGVSKLVGVKLAENGGNDGEIKQPRPQPKITQRQFSLEGAEQEPSLALSR